MVIYNCSSLANDLHKIFQSYWVMGQSNSSLPVPWPSKYDTDINKYHPLLVEADNVSSRIYLSVSSLSFSSFLQGTFVLDCLQRNDHTVCHSFGQGTCQASSCYHMEIMLGYEMFFFRWYLFSFHPRLLHHHSVLHQGLRTWRLFSPSSQRLSTMLM